jgi:hypothetical protein
VIVVRQFGLIFSNFSMDNDQIVAELQNRYETAIPCFFSAIFGSLLDLPDFTPLEYEQALATTSNDGYSEFMEILLIGILNNFHNHTKKKLTQLTWARFCRNVINARIGYFPGETNPIDIPKVKDLSETPEPEYMFFFRLDPFTKMTIVTFLCNMLLSEHEEVRKFIEYARGNIAKEAPRIVSWPHVRN